ncbi:MAG: dihydroxyacetone kinase subunit L [Anaerolineae bacterium]|nr:dihydroxyacetone kinase subunit L [Anaerolineae bacterium]
MAVSRDNLLAWIEALQKVYAENKDYLTQLDSAIGDADHGINMNRGFNKVQEELAKTPPADIAAALKTVAMTLIKTVGGASGPLYGTFFLRGGTTCAGKATLEAVDVVEFWQAGLEGVVQRGKAEVGDKTMVDALVPAVEAMRQAASSGSDLANTLKKGVAAAEAGMKKTTPLQAKKGRASYLGERSIGHQDPGATSSYLMLKTAAEIWR